MRCQDFILLARLNLWDAHGLWEDGYVTGMLQSEMILLCNCKIGIIFIQKFGLHTSVSRMRIKQFRLRSLYYVYSGFYHQKYAVALAWQWKKVSYFIIQFEMYDTAITCALHFTTLRLPILILQPPSLSVHGEDLTGPVLPALKREMLKWGPSELKICSVSSRIPCLEGILGHSEKIHECSIHSMYYIYILLTSVDYVLEYLSLLS